MATLAAQSDRFTGPVRDGIVVMGTLSNALAHGSVPGVPLIIGSTTADNTGAVRARTVEEAFAVHFASNMTQAQNAYGSLAKAEPQLALREIGRDLGYREPARKIAALIREHGLPAFEYRFGYVAEVMQQEWPEGPPHGSDLPYAMDLLGERYEGTVALQDAEVARKMHRYWVNFVRTGNPNGDQLAVWPTYSAKDDYLMRFQSDGSATAATDPLRARLDAVSAARRN